MPERRRSKLVITFVLFLLLLNYPILSIVDSQKLVWGFPQLYFYLFFVWLTLIVVIAFIVLRPNK
jgi:hypothetical protein